MEGGGERRERKKEERRTVTINFFSLSLSLELFLVVSLEILLSFASLLFFALFFAALCFFFVSLSDSLCRPLSFYTLCFELNGALDQHSNRDFVGKPRLNQCSDRTERYDTIGLNEKVSSQYPYPEQPEHSSAEKITSPYSPGSKLEKD